MNELSRHQRITMLCKNLSKSSLARDAQDALPSVSKVHQIIRSEEERDMVAETCIRVKARNGLVRMTGTDQYYATDQESVWFTTDDLLFKGFAENALLMLHKALLHDKGGVCARASKMCGDGHPQAYRLSVLGRKIVQCCNQYRDDWDVAYANHVFNPITTVMLRGMKRYAPFIVQWENQGATQAPELARLLEKLARFVRRACRTRRFIKELKTQERKAQDNFNSAREFVCQLADKHSRLLILRLDLYSDPGLDVTKAEKHVDGLLRWLRSKACKRNLLPGYLGYVIKCETGAIRGMHWHLMVICDGNLHRKGGYLSQKLGEAWASRTGQGLGGYYNCWADRAKYHYDGLGMLELDDWEKMVGLRKALHYLTKQDCVLKVISEKGRCFRRSERKKAGCSRAGRRRHRHDSLELLKRMLGGKRSKYPPGFEPQLRLGHMPSARAALHVHA